MFYDFNLQKKITVATVPSSILPPEFETIIPEAPFRIAILASRPFIIPLTSTWNQKFLDTSHKKLMKKMKRQNEQAILYSLWAAQHVTM